MERFNYPSLSALLSESTLLLRLLEAESYGRKKDEAEEYGDELAKMESQRLAAEYE